MLAATCSYWIIIMSMQMWAGIDELRRKVDELAQVWKEIGNLKRVRRDEVLLAPSVAGR